MHTILYHTYLSKTENGYVQFKEMNPVCVSVLRVIAGLMMFIGSFPLLLSIPVCVYQKNKIKIKQ